MVERPARQLADDLWLLDTIAQGEPGSIASYLLTGSAGAALIDVGSAATLAQLLAAIRGAGVAPSEVQHLVLTHIHLDHAGAAGRLLRHTAPDATVYVHPRGAPHLSDPSRLLQSAARIYGDRLHALWGETVPIAPGRLRTVADGDAIRVGGRTLRVLYTPGHATHHIAYHDAERGEVFTGDVAGVRLEGNTLVRPPTPPPDLQLAAWYASIDRLLALAPRTLLLAHFGAVHNVQDHLGALRTGLKRWGEQLLDGMRRGLATDDLTQMLTALERAELARSAGASGEDEVTVRRRYDVAANHRMSVQGYERYYRTDHPELLAT